MAGTVRVSRRPLRRPGARLVLGQTLEARVDMRRLEDPSAAPRTPSATIAAADILFEDRWLLAIAKPAGLPFHPTADASRLSLVEAVRGLLAARAGAEGPPPYLGVHQRLDRDTSGCALFVKAPEANAGLASAFAAHAVQKTYHALSVRAAHPPGRAWTIDAPLGRAGRGRTARVAPLAGGETAETEVRVLRELPRALLLECRPRTGRQHQIRAHLASEGLPLLGDARYGGPVRLGPVTFPRVLLHALRLELPHPVTGEPLRIECGYPPDMTAVLAALESQVPEGPRNVSRLRHRRRGV